VDAYPTPASCPHTIFDGGEDTEIVEEKVPNGAADADAADVNTRIPP
jgi:hypothetical protein